ncbi:MAG TPA: hypothetical protein VJ881_10215 [Halanaerobiales bacterium]|nr:hypothetical protein [Halanaerobiales bacterium]
MKFILILILLFLNIPLFKLIYRKIFIDKDDLKESVKYSVIPDIYSLFKGNFFKDIFGEFKLKVFLITCIIIIGLEFVIIKNILSIF